MTELLGLWRHTLRELLRPTRLAPMLLVAVPLVVSQHYFSQDKVLGDGIGVALIASFVLFGPFSWRWMVAPGTHLRLVWPVVGLFPFAVGAGMSQMVEVYPTFLLSSVTGFLACALFLVGSWGLGRDIELATGLDRMTERAEALAKAARASEILAMQAHLDPHFLFNTLNAIAEWCVVDGERAERAVLDLAQVLRRITTGVQQTQWPLTEELDLARKVLELHHARDPSRFELDFPDVASDATVPPLLLLPLVENAITHGVAKGHRGVVQVAVELTDEVVVRIRNPGPYDGPRDQGNGLTLVRDRLQLAFEDRASLRISGADGVTTAVVRWPHG